MLKQDMHVWLKKPENPAAFRRLCVETSLSSVVEVKSDPAAFRRLCVETEIGKWN